MPEERELGHGKQPLPRAAGLVDVVATIIVTSLWCRLTLGPAGPGEQCSTSKAAEMGTSRSEPKKGDKQLMAEMSFTKTGGSRRWKLLVPWSFVLKPQFGAIFKCVPIS